MRALRRAVVAVVLGGLVGVALRLRGATAPPTEVGGWRELQGDDLR
ncbi:MAG: hypothetical protein ACOYOP_16595 [Microthrixaceae bacterium]